jgi:hypothetical protein
MRLLSWSIESAEGNEEVITDIEAMMTGFAMLRNDIVRLNEDIQTQ